MNALKDLGAQRGNGPEPLPADELCENGRGLMPVDALATRWGSRAALASRLL